MGSEYALQRRARMEENRKRMEDLGILGITASMAADTGGKRKRGLSSSALPAHPSGPSRRSARLRSLPAPRYVELREERSTSRRSCRNALRAGTEGSKPEVYTDEHEKRLGCAKKVWDLFVDGYKNGQRIYDGVHGKSCHQCRQKTLGLRTSCRECKLRRGQFCGDCLYMRYGENVTEALADEDWTCPVCRDICNCSRCRTAKGWGPTGSLYSRVKAHYKSVAHFLIATRRGDNGDGGSAVELDGSEEEEEEAGNDEEPEEKEPESDDDGGGEAAEMDGDEVIDNKNSKSAKKGKGKKGGSEDDSPAPAEKWDLGDSGDDLVVVVISDSEDDEGWKQRDAAAAAKKKPNRSQQHIAGRLRSRRVIA